MNLRGTLGNLSTCVTRLCRLIVQKEFCQLIVINVYRNNDLGKRACVTYETVANLLFKRMKSAQGEHRAHTRRDHESQQSTESQQQHRAELVRWRPRPWRFFRSNRLGVTRVHVNELPEQNTNFP